MKILAILRENSFVWCLVIPCVIVMWSQTVKPKERLHLRLKNCFNMIGMILVSFGLVPWDLLLVIGLDLFNFTA